MKLKNHTAFFLLVVFAGLLLAALCPFILPERFYFDANYYLYDRYNQIGWVKSYPVTIGFYHITGLKNLPLVLISVIQYISAVFLLTRLGIPRNFHLANLKNFVFVFTLFALAIFFAPPTKEVINFLFIFLVVRLFMNQKRKVGLTVFLAISLFIAFGLWFRQYYLLIPMVAIVMYFISRIRIKQRTFALFFYGILTVTALSLASGVVKGEFMSQSTRESLNEERAGEVASNSIIQSPVPTDNWFGESVGITYGFFSVNFPFHEVIRHYNKPQIVIFAFWQIAFLLVLALIFDRAIKNRTKNKGIIWCFYFLFSYLLIQGVFEPDLGSAVRHKMGILPLIYICLYYDQLKKNNSPKT